jgi:hypothetical protein
MAHLDKTESLAAYEHLVFKRNSLNADIGGGSSDEGTKFLRTHHVKNLVYDKYARSAEHNHKILLSAFNRCDTATSFSVLNVLHCPVDRKSHIQLVHACLKPRGVAYFRIWDGNKTNIPSWPGEGGCIFAQNNRAFDTYIHEIRHLFDVHVVHQQGSQVLVAFKI